MRASLWIAAGLVVTNLLLLEREPPAPAAKPLIAAPREGRAVTIVTPITQHVTTVTPDAQRLAWLWAAKHAAFAPPACEQHDPLATLDADVDPAPGLEHVIGNRRFGVAIYAADNTLIAHMDPVGCVAPSEGDQSLSLSFNHRLVVRTRQLEADGEHLDAYVIEPKADELVTVLKLDVGGKRVDRSREREVEGRLYFGDGEVEVKHHGRERVRGGAWQEVDEHCTWQLATRTSSCRKRAGARTPGSE